MNDKTAAPVARVTLSTYEKEFMAIVRHLISKGGPIQRDNSVYVSKDDLFKLYSRNAYQTPDGKLRIWRGLHWIETDSGRLTRRVSVGGKMQPMVKINREVYETMTQLQEL